MTEQSDRSPQPPGLAYESPTEPLGRHGSLVYLRDDAGGLIVTGPHGDAMHRWPRAKRLLAILLGAGLLMAMVGAAFGGLMIDLRPATLGVRGNALARMGVYVALASGAAIATLYVLLYRRRGRVTIETNRDGVTYRVREPDGQERIEHWAADQITGVGGGFDNGLIVALRDGRHVKLHLGRHYAEWVRLAEDINRSLGRPVAELAPGEKRRTWWG